MAQTPLTEDWKRLYGETSEATIAASKRAPKASGTIDFALPLTVYTVPGCSACLRTKEFLKRHGVAFVDVNPLVDKAGFDAMEAIGIKRLPIAARGAHWADGQVLQDLARIAGIALEAPKQLAPAVLVARGQRVMRVACGLAASIPPGELALMLPDRPRSYKHLACHIFQIYEVFCEWVEEGKPLEFVSYFREVPAAIRTPADVAAFGAAMLQRFDAWWARAAATTDFRAKADVYYGDQTEQSLHDFLERTVWHSAHHTRQLQTVLGTLHVKIADPLTAADLAGLPLPDSTYDDKVRLS